MAQIGKNIVTKNIQSNSRQFKRNKVAAEAEAHAANHVPIEQYVSEFSGSINNQSAFERDEEGVKLNQSILGDEIMMNEDLNTHQNVDQD